MGHKEDFTLDSNYKKYRAAHEPSSEHLEEHEKVNASPTKPDDFYKDWLFFSRSHVLHIPWKIRVLTLICFIIFVFIGATYFGIVKYGLKPETSWLPMMMTILWLVSGAAVLILVYWGVREFATFCRDLSDWAERLRRREVSVRMPIYPQCPSFRIRQQINSITEDYEILSADQQKRFAQQAKYIRQKKHYLGVLYQVASCVESSQSLEELLPRILKSLKNIANAEAVAVRLRDKEGQMRLVASQGLSDEVVKREEVLPTSPCLCADVAECGQIRVRHNVGKCARLIGEDFFDSDKIVMLAIPLQYQNKTLGIYNLFVSAASSQELKEEYELLISIGKHLGLAIAKAAVDEEARYLSIMEERTRMAHELHDSLAQSLASLRFQIRVLDDSLHRGDEAILWQELEKVEESVDEAYAELRSLISHFRAPMDDKGVVYAVERVVDRFRQETDIEAFFYQNWNAPELPTEVELEVVRIVQEALVNIRRHSKAETVRILMYSDEEGCCRVLVEDDGIGIMEDRPQADESSGEHIGLEVMKERAERISGEIQIESDSGEGTLVQLNFNFKPARKLSDLIAAADLH